ncbi:hypothetical protein [Streptomyces alanosinicus]|uniref:Core-binding (CB) domain-containing protein n=1 Tax=Streptomyces alanosinicus TaxID=68171 RepID=A0A919D6C7_9ACTN|nr:hypothetical protein [Streptomyces alanosinicus]GHE11918.1 hypothetical protein GCM10010339_73340 [Streptomyces alanosinicus]
MVVSAERRVKRYLQWCDEAGLDPLLASSLLLFLQDLADRRRLSSTLESYNGTLAGWLREQGHPLAAADRHAVRQIKARLAAAEELEDDSVPMRATQVTEVDVARMAAACDRDTDRGRRDVLVLLLYRYAASALAVSHPLQLDDVHDVVLRTAGTQTLPSPGSMTALEVRCRSLRPHAPDQVLRLPAHANPQLCPVRAWQEWMSTLRAAGVAGVGPLFRRIDRHGTVAGHRPVAGRQPKDPAQRAGISLQTIGNILRDLATAAGLSPRLHADERLVLSTVAGQAALAAAPPEEQIRVDAARQVQRRRLRRSRPRYTPLSMPVSASSPASGIPADLLLLYSRYLVRPSDVLAEVDTSARS